MADGWDGNSALPIPGSNIGNQSAYGMPSGTKTGKTGTTGTSQTSEKVSSSGASSQINMPPEAAAALNALIGQLGDHPAMSELAAQAELQKMGMRPPARTWSNAVTGSRDGAPIIGGWIYTDEMGRPVDLSTFEKAQARYNTAKEHIITAGGMVEGGTQESKQQNAERATEISRNRTTQDKYTKEAAFTDANALTSRFVRQMLETILPDINRSVEASGSSGGAVAALLKQDAAARTGEAAAAQGLQASEAYGQINAQFSTILEQLTRQNPVALQALLQAFNVSKGSVQFGTQSQTQMKEGETLQTGTQQAVEDVQGRMNLPSAPTRVNVSKSNQAPASLSRPELAISVNRGGSNAEPYAGVTFGS